MMARDGNEPEEIAAKLRHLEVMSSKSNQVLEAILSLGVNGLRANTGAAGALVWSLSRLGTGTSGRPENALLRKAACDLTLEKLTLAEAANRNF